jgi:energy-coupling factor transporter ATP-binding protein EcfA2
MQRTLSSEEKIILEAEEIPIFKRKEIISAKKETELHKLLSKLFSAMEPDHNVVITHGSNEYGKDLVIISNDKFGSTTRAAVVKCGAISGQATKEIDEILSQTRMAFKHPYSPNGIDEYHVSEVIVVASGRITENAKKRINSELNENNIKLYDLDKLVDLFTTYYPRIFFGGLEHDYASQQIERLDQVRAFSGRTGSLRNLFVEQTLKSTAVSTKTSGTFSTSKKSVRYKELPALIRKKKRVALVGEAGSGKTSLLKMLAIDSLRNYKNALLVDDANTPSVSLFCEAKSVLEHDKSTSLLAFLRDLSSCPETVQIGTVLVDGLDEIKLEKRKDVINALDLLLAEGLSVVISSRCEDTFEATEWARYEIAPMTTGQALTLCEKVVSDECLSLTLKESIKDIKKRITLTPLAIFLLLEIIEEHQEVPASLTELYDQYVDNVLGKHDKEKAIESLFEYESKKRFLAEIAYGELVQKDVDLISIKDFERIGQRFFKDYEWPWSSWVTLVDELKRSSLVFIDEEAGMLHFRHRSFLEYFAAYALYVGEQGDNVGISCAIEYYFDPQWTDIAFYYFGLKKSMSSEIMTQILLRRIQARLCWCRKCVLEDFCKHVGIRRPVQKDKGFCSLLSMLQKSEINL